mgnify:CR=1 FL=1
MQKNKVNTPIVTGDKDSELDVVQDTRSNNE